MEFGVAFQAKENGKGTTEVGLTKCLESRGIIQLEYFLYPVSIPTRNLESFTKSRILLANYSWLVACSVDLGIIDLVV